MNKERREIEEAVDQLLEERVLELLDEIPDGYAGSAFDDYDRDNIRTAIENGWISDVLPGYNEMVRELADELGGQKVPLASVDPSRLADRADIASMYIAHLLAGEAELAMDDHGMLPSR